MSSLASIIASPCFTGSTIRHCQSSPKSHRQVFGSAGRACAGNSIVRKRFSGLRMSSSEGIMKRARDPQVQSEAEGKTGVAARRTTETAKRAKNYVAATISKPGVKSLLVAVAIPLILGSLDGLVNSPNSDWYKELRKPAWQPPNFLFGGTWSLLYPLMGLASWLVWAEGGFDVQAKPLSLYAAQLVLNLLWPYFFFGKHNLGLALVDIVALCGTLFATMQAFRPVNQVAATLLKPYFGWVLFATALNTSLWYMNRGTSAPPAVRAD